MVTLMNVTLVLNDHSLMMLHLIYLVHLVLVKMMMVSELVVEAVEPSCALQMTHALWWLWWWLMLMKMLVLHY